MTANDNGAPAGGAAAIIDRLARFFAHLGGFIGLGVGVLVTVSVLMRWLLGSGIPGDFELVQIATAVMVFSFFPKCQATRGHVVVDSFSGNWSTRTRNRVDALWDVVYALIMGAIGFQLIRGGLEALRNHTVSMVLELPAGPTILFCGVLAVVVMLVSLVTAWRLIGSKS